MFEKKKKQCNWSIKKDTTNYVFKTSVHPGVMKINDFFMIINGELIDNISSYEFSVFLHGRNRISAYVNFFEFFQRNFYFQNRLLWTEMVQYCIVHILNSRLLECASIIYIHVLWYNILISWLQLLYNKFWRWFLFCFAGENFEEIISCIPMDIFPVYSCLN